MNKLAVLALAFLMHGVGLVAASCSLVAGESNIDIVESATSGFFDLSVEYSGSASACFDLLPWGDCSNIFTDVDVVNSCKYKITKSLVELQTLGFTIEQGTTTTYIARATLRSFDTEIQTLRSVNANKTIEFSRELTITIETAASFSATGVKVYPKQNVEKVTTAVIYNRGQDYLLVDLKTVVQSSYYLGVRETNATELFYFGVSRSLYKTSVGGGLVESLFRRTNCMSIVDNVVCEQVWSHKLEKKQGCDVADYSFDLTLSSPFKLFRVGGGVDPTEEYDHDTIIKSGLVCTDNLDVNLFKNVIEAELNTCDSALGSSSNVTDFFYGDDICLYFKVDLLYDVKSIITTTTLGAKSVGSGITRGLRCGGTGSMDLSDFPSSCSAQNATNELSFTFGFATNSLYFNTNNGDAFLANDATLIVTLTATMATSSRRLRKLVESSNPGNNAESFSAVVGSISSRPRPGTVSSSELLQGSPATSGSNVSPVSVPNWAIALIVIAAAALSVVLLMKALKSYKSYRAVAKVSQNTYSASSPTLQSSA